MLTEMLGKGGQVCQQAREGRIRCPLIIRPSSEDVITGQLFQSLGAIAYRWWLPECLNLALGASHFRQQVYRNPRIVLWKNRSAFPRELLPWNEGSTQVDVTITCENPPTTIFIEMKYGADLTPRTSGDDGSHGYPSDQLIRNVRVGLLECGWFCGNEMFQVRPRRFCLVVVGPTKGHQLVATYRDRENLIRAIPHSERLYSLPDAPFVGELEYRDIVLILRRNQRWMTRPERVVADQLIDYLMFKARRVSSEESLTQKELPVIEK